MKPPHGLETRYVPLLGHFGIALHAYIAVIMPGYFEFLTADTDC